MINIVLFIFLHFQSYAQNSYAQNNSATTVLNQTLGSVQPAPPTAAATSGATSAPQTESNLLQGGVVANQAKYEEHQSICRTNEYDLVVHFPKELKEKRIKFLKNIVVADNKNSAKIELRLAKEYLDQNKSAEFKTITTELKSLKLSTFDNTLLNALLAFSTRNLSSARTILSKLLVDNENNIDILYFLAEVYLAEHNYFEASAIYEDLNKLTKNSYLIQHCQTMVLNASNADGEKLCLQAASKNPKSPIPNIYIGISYRERGNFKKALQSFKKSIAVKPTEMGLTCLAELFFIEENYILAIEQFKKSIELNSNSDRAVLGLAWAHLKQKDYAASLEAFKKACRMNNKNQIELRKAFKELRVEKAPVAKKFIDSIESCDAGNF